MATPGRMLVMVVVVMVVLALALEGAGILCVESVMGRRIRAHVNEVRLHVGVPHMHTRRSHHNEIHRAARRNRDRNDLLRAASKRHSSSHRYCSALWDHNGSVSRGCRSRGVWRARIAVRAPIVAGLRCGRTRPPPEVEVDAEWLDRFTDRQVHKHQHHQANPRHGLRHGGATHS